MNMNTDGDHDWYEVDGGTGCRLCDLWYPDGQAPWDDPVDDDLFGDDAFDNSDTVYGVCVLCGGEWGDEWTCCHCGALAGC